MVQHSVEMKSVARVCVRGELCREPVFITMPPLLFYWRIFVAEKQKSVGAGFVINQIFKGDVVSWRLIYIRDSNHFLETAELECLGQWLSAELEPPWLLHDGSSTLPLGVQKAATSAWRWRGHWTIPAVYQRAWQTIVDLLCVEGEEPGGWWKGGCSLKPVAVWRELSFSAPILVECTSESSTMRFLCKCTLQPHAPIAILSGLFLFV